MLRWYLASSRVEDDLYRSLIGVLEAADFEPDTGAAPLWGMNTRAALSEAVLVELVAMWQASKEGLLRPMRDSSQLGNDVPRIRRLVMAFEGGLTAPTAP